MKTFSFKEELISLIVGAIILLPRFRVIFGQYSPPWRERRQEFEIAQLERVPSVLKLYEDIQSKNSEIEKLNLKIEALKIKLLKCTLFMRQTEYPDFWKGYDIIPSTIKGKYRNYADSFKNSLRKYKTWNNEKNSMYKPILYPTWLPKIPSLPVKTPNFRNPRPSCKFTRSGITPQQYPLAEPIPGMIPITPPPIIFPRKIIKIPEFGSTTKMSKLEKQNVSTISPIGTTTKKGPSMEPFYIHEAIKIMNNFSQTTETSFRINPVYIGEQIDYSRTSFENNNSNISNFNQDSFEMLKEDEPESRKQNRDSLDYLFQPRQLKKLQNLEKGRLTKNHYNIPKTDLLSLGLSLIPPTIIPPPPSNKTEEVTAEEPEIITAPFPFDNISLNEPKITNSPTPSVITRENMKNFNLNESLVLFNVADNKNSDMENRKYRITNLTHNMPYYTNSTGMRQSRLGNISTLVSSSVLVEER